MGEWQRRDAVEGKSVLKGQRGPSAVTGEAGLALIKGRALDATYVIGGEYPPVKPGTRFAKTYEALRDGPQTGYHLYFHGNHMPTKEGRPPMRPPPFREHLKWMVRERRLHVVREESLRHRTYGSYGRDPQ